MPFEIYEQLVFNEMKQTALNTDCDAFRDLPGLVCGTCCKLTSFGGRTSFEEGDFTTEDICICCINNN